MAIAGRWLRHGVLLEGFFLQWRKFSVSLLGVRLFIWNFMFKRRLSLQQTRRIAQQNNQGVAGDVAGCEGLVISPLRQQAEIEDCVTGERVRCHLRANLPPLTVGDRVIWQSGSPTGVVVALKPRRNCIQRPDSFGNLKLVAANVDNALIVLALSRWPTPI